MTMLDDAYSEGMSAACEKVGVDLHSLQMLAHSGAQAAGHYLPMAGHAIADAYGHVAGKVGGVARGAVNLMRDNPEATLAGHGAAAVGLGSDVIHGMKQKLKHVFRGTPPAAKGWSTGSKVALGAGALGAGALAAGKLQGGGQPQPQPMPYPQGYYQG